MSILINEIKDILGRLNEYYYEVEDKRERQKIKENFEILSNLLEQAVRKQLDENDEIYQQAVAKLKETVSQIEKLKKQLLDSTEFFKNLSDLINKLDYMINKEPEED